MAQPKILNLDPSSFQDTEDRFGVSAKEHLRSGEGEYDVVVVGNDDSSKGCAVYCTDETTANTVADIIHSARRDDPELLQWPEGAYIITISEFASDVTGALERFM